MEWGDLLVLMLEVWLEHDNEIAINLLLILCRFIFTLWKTLACSKLCTLNAFTKSHPFTLFQVENYVLRANSNTWYYAACPHGNLQ